MSTKRQADTPSLATGAGFFVAVNIDVVAMRRTLAPDQIRAVLDGIGAVLAASQEPAE